VVKPPSPDTVGELLRHGGAHPGVRFESRAGSLVHEVYFRLRPIPCLCHSFTPPDGGASGPLVTSTSPKKAGTHHARLERDRTPAWNRKPPMRLLSQHLRALLQVDACRGCEW